MQQRLSFIKTNQKFAKSHKEIHVDTDTMNILELHNPDHITHHGPTAQRFLEKLIAYLGSVQYQRRITRVDAPKDDEFIREVTTHSSMMILLLKKIEMAHGPIFPAEYGYGDQMDLILRTADKYVSTPHSGVISIVELDIVDGILQSMIETYYRVLADQDSFWTRVKSLFL